MAAGLGSTSLLQHEPLEHQKAKERRRTATSILSTMSIPLPGGHQFPSQWHQLLCGSLRPLWCLVASPTHGQRGHEQEGP